MNHRYYYGTLCAAVVALAAFAPVAHADLDTPTLNMGIGGHGKQALTITAGPSGAPQGFTIWWMNTAQFASHGFTWPTQTAPGQGEAMFTGVPTLNTFGGSTFRLGASQSVTIEIGDLFDETGVAGTVDELAYGNVYHFVVFAQDANGTRVSGLSQTVSGSTTTSTNCTLTQGYWKNHPEAWPVTSLTLGTVVYTKDELLEILDASVSGNGLVSLAHQLIAAKLNVAAGAEPSAATATIAAADAQINGLVVPTVGSGYIHPSLTSTKTQTLDDFNNGVVGPGHCGVVPVEKASWGSIKAMYR